MENTMDYLYQRRKDFIPPTESLLHRLDRKLRGIDIEKEYALIKIKESKLSAQLRKLVVEKYEKIKG